MVRETTIFSHHSCGKMPFLLKYDMSNFTRINQIKKTLQKKSVLLLGPRRTGKSFFIKNQIKPDLIINLLEANTFRKFSARPELLREVVTDEMKIVAIDEIQKLPSLMDEVHNLIEEKKIRFLLTGSSARKLARTHTSLMAGRARRVYFHPFTFQELQENKSIIDLDHLLNYGALPPVLLATDPWEELRDYVGLYLKEDIQAEAMVRKIENFSRFLEFSAMNSGELLNFESIASDAQVPARTIREYYAVLVDTLMGTMLEPLSSTVKRKSVSAAKFYFFDTGVLNSLLERKQTSSKTKEYGNLFEHFILNEIRAYVDYNATDTKLNFWRVDQETEVDIIINHTIAIEIKSTDNVVPKHLKGLKKFAHTGACSKQIVVSRDPMVRQIDEIQILPYQDFLQKLWAGDIF